MIKEIEKYFSRILIPQLDKLGVSAVFRDMTVATIYKQMYSVAANWSDKAFLNTLFLTVSEEAPFYQPEADIAVKSFVVLTVRNSPIETLQGGNYRKAGLDRMISEAQLKEITSEAIRYFKDIDFAQLEDEEAYNLDMDGYYLLSQKYPIAWNALNCVANSDQYSDIFKGFCYADPPEYLQLKPAETDWEKMTITFVDGYAVEIDEALKRQLSSIIHTQNVFAVDCFKMVSRNMEKLLLVLEMLLQYQCRFVSANYYVENGYFEKRKKVLRAASSKTAISDMRRHFSDFNGVGKDHAYFMRLVNA